jgi:dCTP deaminase
MPLTLTRKTTTMMLSDGGIKQALKNHSITIDPYNPVHLQSASYDVHLGDTLLVPQRPKQLTRWQRFIGLSAPWIPTHYDPSTDEQPLMEVHLLTHEEAKRTGEYYWLPPGGVALGHTQEILTLDPNVAIAADIAGCSSLGRWWLFVHCTAGFIDPGWQGRLTLELFNASPWWLRIWAGMRIAQIRFYEMSAPSVVTYNKVGHYAGATTVQPSKYEG